MATSRDAPIISVEINLIQTFIGDWVGGLSVLFEKQYRAHWNCLQIMLFHCPHYSNCAVYDSLTVSFIGNDKQDTRLCLSSWHMTCLQVLSYMWLFMHNGSLLCNEHCLWREQTSYSENDSWDSCFLIGFLFSLCNGKQEWKSIMPSVRWTNNIHLK